MSELLIYEGIGEYEVSAKSFAADLKALGDTKEISVRINSPGGNVFDGCTIYNLLKQHEAEVTVHIDGFCASIASVIAMAGDKIIMADNALMMIHDPWSIAVGSADDFRAEADILDKVKQSLLTTYEARTGMSRDEISAMMSDETWLDAEEAKTFGFIDESVEPLLAAASIKENIKGDFAKNVPMNYMDKLTEKLEVPGAPVEETAEEEVQATAAPTEGNTNSGKGEQDMPENKIDLEKVKLEGASDALAADKTRRESIAAVFESFGQHADLMRQCQDSQDCTVEAAQTKLLNALGSNEEPTGGNIEMGVDSSEKFRQGAASALEARSGLAKHDPTNEFRGYTMVEMARASLERNGANTAGLDKMSLIANAFTHSTGDFGNILSNTANKSMLKGWEEAAESFEAFTSKGSLPDFKSTLRADLNTFPALDKVLPGAEYGYVSIGDRGETLQLATYGQLFNINRQAIINDDLGMFTKVPMKFGNAAKRTVGNLVWALITGNVTMSDGTALFHADHKNIGTGGTITTASIDEMRKLMAVQTDPDGNATLNIRPKYLLVPEALRGKAIQAIESETEIASSQSNSKRPNYVRGIADVISDARLDTNSAVKYYMAADAGVYDGIEVSYLDGMDQPFLDQTTGWEIDGSSFKVRIDAGVKCLDFRTFAYNAGA